jgi:nucleoid-associated protein YgaU
MRSSRTHVSFSLALLLTLSGCGYVHVGRLPEPVVTTVIGDEKLSKENSDLRLEKKMLQHELALTRAQGEALRSALENRAADGDTSRKLIEKLNATTRELATLRTSYAALQSERSQGSGADADALRAQLGAAEEKLAASLRTYTDLQEEVVRLRTDVDRTRAENVVLGEQVKTITAKNEEAQAALAQLNTDLLSQKDARLRAEQDAATLRSELKVVAPNSSALAQQRTGAAADARSLVAEHAAETAALKQELDGLRTKVDALTAERSQLKLKLQEGGSSRPTAVELAAMEGKLSSALSSASALRDENEQLKGRLSQLKTGTAGSAGSQSLRDELREARAQATALTEENSRLRSRLIASAMSNGSSAPVTTAAATPPAAVTTGGVTLTPRQSGVSATFVANVPAAQRGTPPSKAEPSHAEPAVGRVHVVVGGDTLAKISTLYYGTPGRWGDILAANRDVLGESNNLVVGRTLRIP